MFANYPAGVFSSKPRFKFEFVEEKRHPDYALLGDVLEDIKKRLVIDHQYPEGLPDLVEVPQSWDRDATAQFGWKRRGVDVSPK